MTVLNAATPPSAGPSPLVPHGQFSARFEREARAISSLIIRTSARFTTSAPNYLVMELLEGDTIAARLKNAPRA